MAQHFSRPDNYLHFQDVFNGQYLNNNNLMPSREDCLCLLTPLNSPDCPVHGSMEREREAVMKIRKMRELKAEWGKLGSEKERSIVLEGIQKELELVMMGKCSELQQWVDRVAEETNRFDLGDQQFLASVKDKYKDSMPLEEEILLHSGEYGARVEEAMKRNAIDNYSLPRVPFLQEKAYSGS